MSNHSHQSRVPRVEASKWDDVIVVLFALLGFIGAVFLYRTNSAPIIISFFLATGVASLVYRFLGGLQGKFVWGALKLTGSIAVLAGIAIGVDAYLEHELPVMTSVAGRYEWQVPGYGGGWDGYIEVQKDTSAQIEMLQYMTCRGEKNRQQLPVFKQTGPGTVQGIENLTKLRVKIPVQFITYDADCKTKGNPETTILEGDIERAPAFAGEIHYHNDYGSPLGKIRLVKTLGSGVH